MEEKEDGASLPCPLFFRTHCPDIKRGCKFHHNIQMCLQGGACGDKTCALRHPPNCQLFLQGWCGFISKQGIPKRYKHCSYFNPPNVKKKYPLSLARILHQRITKIQSLLRMFPRSLQPLLWDPRMMMPGGRRGRKRLCWSREGGLLPSRPLNLLVTPKQ